MLMQLLRIIMQHPTLKARAVLWVQQYPWLELRLRRLAVNSGLVYTRIAMIQAPNNAPADLATEIAKLTPAARCIHERLKVAIAAKQGVHL